MNTLSGFGRQAVAVLALVAVWLAGMATTPALASEAPAHWRASCFVFRDINRDGIYNMGDVPYAGLAVEMKRPDGSTIRRFSNLAGFANFEMRSNNNAKGDIIAAGTYHMHAAMKFGWIATAKETADQAVEFKVKLNAGSGLVPVQPCKNIGVAPDLAIVGAVFSQQGASLGDISVVSRFAFEEPQPASVDAGGNFSIKARRGNWTLTATNQRTGKTAERLVEVGDYSVIVSAIDPDRTEPKASEAPIEIANFDTLTSSDTLLEIPSGYLGLNWAYWVATQHKFYNGSGYVNATISGEYVAYNSSGVPASIWSDEPFDFEGVHVGAAWSRGEEDFVTVKAWRNGNLAYQDVFAISRSGPFYFNASYRGIDKVVFSHGNYERIVIDNLAFRR